MADASNPAGAFRAELDRLRETGAAVGANPTEVRLFDYLLEIRVMNRKAAALPVEQEERDRYRSEVCGVGRSTAEAMRGLHRPGSERMALEFLYAEFGDLPAMKDALLRDLIDLQRREPLTGPVPAAPEAGADKAEPAKKSRLTLLLLILLIVETLALMGLTGFTVYRCVTRPSASGLVDTSGSGEAAQATREERTAAEDVTAEERAAAEATETPAPTATPKVKEQRPKNSPTPTPAPTEEPLYNGKLLVRPSYRQDRCRLTVNAGTDANYYIYLKYLSAPGPGCIARTPLANQPDPPVDDLAFYVTAGSSATVNVPVGVYQIYYASGLVFLGTKYKFGPGTSYSMCPEPFSFTESPDGSIQGWTLTLIPQEDGNLKTEDIPALAFPG